MSSSSINNFTRGGQMTMHAIRMMIQSGKYVLKLAIIANIIFFITIFVLINDSYDRYIATKYCRHHVGAFFTPNTVYQPISYLSHTGKIIKMTKKQFLHSPVTKRSLANLQQNLRQAGFYGIFAFITTLTLVVNFFLYRSKNLTQLEHIRGAKNISGKDLAFLLKKRNLASNLALAGVPLIKDSEKQHILLSGTTGSGKTVAMTELMDQVRSQGQKAIVYDCDGSYIANYYRPGKDFILNPLDKRTERWNIWQDCFDQADFEAFAESLIALNAATSDPFWVHASRTILSVTAFSLMDKNPTTKKLLASMLSEDSQYLQDLIKHTVAEPLVSEKIEKTALSIKATLTTHCKSLMYLPEETEQLFSIRDWIVGDAIDQAPDSWLFIATNKQKAPALRSLLTGWLDLAVRSVLSLSRCYDRRIWFFADELASLQQLPSLKDVLAEGRKFGSCFVAAIQDLHQLRNIYGRETAEAILSLFNTKIAFRANSAESALWIERAFGTREVIETKEGYSYGANDIRDGVTLNKERRREPIILASEISNLNNLEAYLKLPGDFPVGKIQFQVKARAEVEPGNIPMDIPRTNLLFKPKHLNDAAEIEPLVNKKIVRKPPIINNTLKQEQLTK